MNHKTADVRLDNNSSNSTTDIDMKTADVCLDNNALYVDCQSSGQQITDYFAGELSAAASEQLMAHLETCATCRKEFEEFDEIWSMTGEVLAEDNIIESLSEDRRAVIVEAQPLKDKTKQKSPIFIREIIKYGSVAAIILIFAGVLLPDFNRVRNSEKAERYVVKNETVPMEFEQTVDSDEARDEVIGQAITEAPSIISKHKKRKECNQLSRNRAHQMEKTLLQPIEVSHRSTGVASAGRSRQRGAAKLMMGKRLNRAQKKSVKSSIHEQSSFIEKDKVLQMNVVTASRPHKIPLQTRLAKQVIKPDLFKEDAIMTNRLGSDKVLGELKIKACPVSTLSIDANKLSYLQTKQLIMNGQQPEPIKISEAEFVNYFDYHYRSPDKTVFGVYLEIAPAPFRSDRMLLRIGVKGKTLGLRSAAVASFTPISVNARTRTIASELTIQVEFNAVAVSEYYKIGSHQRTLSKTGLHHDIINIGEFSSGAAVTTLYEMKLNSELSAKTVLAIVRLRYKLINSDEIIEDEFVITANEVKRTFAVATPSFKLAALIAEFATALHYPEKTGIASSSAIAKKLSPLFQRNFKNDDKVAELLLLMQKVK